MGATLFMTMTIKITAHSAVIVLHDAMYLATHYGAIYNVRGCSVVSERQCHYYAIELILYIAICIVYAIVNELNFNTYLHVFTYTFTVSWLSSALSE